MAMSSADTNAEQLSYTLSRKANGAVICFRAQFSSFYTGVDSPSLFSYCVKVSQ